MGCWYGTCGVSQLPIKKGDEVALFLLKRNTVTQRMTGDYVNLGAGISCADDLYNPIATPIYGTYNDYGLINFPEDKSLLMQLKQFPIKSYGDDYEIQNLTEFLEDVEKGKIDNYSFMLVHKSIMNKLTYNLGNTPMSNSDKTLKETLELDALKLLIILGSEEKPTGFIGNLALDKCCYDERFEDNLFAMETTKELKYYRNPLIYENNIELLDKVINLILFKQLMQQLRKLWIPQAGAGSQNYEIEYVNVLKDFIDKIEFDS